MGGGEVIKEGWLVKSPPLEGGGIKVWRKRYFKLRSSKVLEYYKNEEADQLKGVINLEDCISVHSDLSHKKYKYVFDVETRTRVYYLVAQDQQEMKQWVDILCRVCGLIVHQDIPVQDALAPPNATYSTGGSATLNPTISHPIYAPTGNTPRTNSASMAFNERFRPSEGVPVESLYSMAQAAETDVQRELGEEQQVEAGVPLMEALATKGIGTRTSSLSSASGGDALTGRVSDSSLSPRHEQSARGDGPGNEYGPTPHRGGTPSYRPTPKPRSTSMIPLSDRLAASDVAGPQSRDGGVRAETMQNGYMKPRPVQNIPPQFSNYDQVPPGPPRPAPVPNRRHKSSLLNNNEVETIVDDSGHTYVNMQRPRDPTVPPQITRSNKPTQPSPPHVNRRLKPGNPSESSPGQDVSLEDSFTQQDLQSSMARTSLVNDGDSFAESDIPRRSRGTMKYTQVQFHGATRSPYLEEPVEEDSSKKLSSPAPLPRHGVSRVNYSDVDIEATRALAEAGKIRKNQVYLEDAEQLMLREKPYINVQRDGDIDENSDPDYYTYMRSQVYEQALDAYHGGDGQGEDENFKEFQEDHVPEFR